MYSDGLVEAHDPQRVMFGFPRLHQILATLPEASRLNPQALLQFLMERLTEFTGPGWDQEDDITMVAVRRS
jgi:serine phosphatase RsbU (regulator of sigma subunit)